MSTRLLRALWGASLTMSPAYRGDPSNKATFLEILKLSRGAYHALKMMNTWSILGRFLIAFRHIVGQMQHDLYHIFTVDSIRCASCATSGASPEANLRTNIPSARR